MYVHLHKPFELRGMKIIITGKPNTGKSTIIKHLRTLLSINSLRRSLQLDKQDYRVISIDAMRKFHGDGTMEGEDRAYGKFFYFAKKNPYCIMECTGYSYRYSELLSNRLYQSTIFFELHADWDTRQHRASEKIHIDKYKPVPFPYFNMPSDGLEKYQNVYDSLTQNQAYVDTNILKYEHLPHHIQNYDIDNTLSEIVTQLIRKRRLMMNQVSDQVSKCQSAKYRSTKCRYKFCACNYLKKTTK